MKILIVEDDDTIRLGLKYYLEQEQFAVIEASTIKTTINMISEETPDLILLDLNLPDGNGFDLFEQIKKIKDIPVIFLTANDLEISIVRGLDMGADDYIVKPFEVEELISRVNAVIRRCHKKIELGDIQINLESRIIKKQGNEIKLTPKEFDLFIYLYENQDKALKREDILEKVWSDEELDSQTLTLHIQRIRKKLDLNDRLKTIHGVGYIFRRE